MLLRAAAASVSSTQGFLTYWDQRIGTASGRIATSFVNSNVDYAVSKQVVQSRTKLDTAPVPPELVTARYHRVNDSTFFIDQHANLSIDERNGQRPLVELTAEEAYGLLMFMRLPGVAQLIEQVDAAAQDRTWQGWESAKAQELTDEQAYERVMDNPRLRSRIHENLIGAAMEMLQERIARIAA